MLGAVLDRPGADIVRRALERGLLINCTAATVLRFLPPLVIDKVQIDEGIAILDEVLADED
jgi:acetylornithine/succinyldiaminopimelate/putrescine aminotransferase